jgi:hypothetical protein
MSFANELFFWNYNEASLYMKKRIALNREICINKQASGFLQHDPGMIGRE